MENQMYVDASSLIDTNDDVREILCRLNDFNRKRIQFIAKNNKRIVTFRENLSDDRVDTAIYNKITKRIPKLIEIENQLRSSSIKKAIEKIILGQYEYLNTEDYIPVIQALPLSQKSTLFNDYIKRITRINDMSDNRIYSKQEMLGVQQAVDDLCDELDKICVDLVRIIGTLDERYTQPFIPADVMDYERKTGKIIKNIVNETTELCSLIDDYYVSSKNAIDSIDKEWDFVSRKVNNLSEERKLAILKTREQFIKNEDSVTRIKLLSDEIRKIIEMELNK